MNAALRLIFFSLLIIAVEGCVGGASDTTEQEPSDSSEEVDGQVDVMGEDESDASSSGDSQTQDVPVNTSDVSEPDDSKQEGDASNGDIEAATQDTAADGGEVDGESASKPASYYEGIVISELMVNPVGISDSNGEWIELINTSEGPLDLRACQLKNPGGASKLTWTDDASDVPPGGFVLLAPQADQALNGGLAVQATYSGLFLANSGDELTIECDSHTAASLAYDVATGWPVQPGRSLAFISADEDVQLDPSLPDSWCPGSTLYTVGNYGSPGAPNPACPVIDADIDDCRLLDLSAEAAVVGSALTASALLFEAGVTDTNPWVDVSADLIGEIGWSAAEFPLNQMDDWSWLPLTATAGEEHPEGVVGWDVYSAQLIAPEEGTYAIAARFSRDGGVTWRWCGLSGSWEDGGSGELGTLTTGPEPCGEGACNTPPANTCDPDGLTLQVYEAVGACTAEGLSPVCTFESGAVDCAALGGTCQDGACIDTAPRPQLGEVIFTEVMANPDQLSDTSAEWFEMTNVTGSARNLDGCIISEVGGGESHIIAPPVALLTEPLAPLLLSRSDDPEANGGLSPAYVYQGVSLANLADSLVLTCDDVVVDSLSWANELGFPIKAGQSLQLAPEAYNAMDNDDGASWCASYIEYAQGNLGTPGVTNPSCTPPGPCDDVICNTPPESSCDGLYVQGFEALGTCVNGACVYTAAESLDCAASGAWCLDGACTTAPNPCIPNPCNDAPASFCDGDVFTHYPVIGSCSISGAESLCDYAPTSTDCAALDGTCIAEGCQDIAQVPSYGDVIITEVMVNPQSASDANGEWFELTNVSDAKVTLASCSILSDGETLEPLSAPTTGALILAPQAQLTVASNADPTVNGGLTGAIAIQLDLNNNDGALELRCGEEVDSWSSVVDSWAYTAQSHAILAGVSLQLSQQAFNADLNDIPEFWCPAVNLYGAGDLGTPGAPNPSCPEVNLCEGIICDDPPSPYCESDIAFSFESVGLCDLGVCDYPGPFQTDCVAIGYTCINGQCVGPPPPIEGCSLLGDADLQASVGVSIPRTVLVKSVEVTEPALPPQVELLVGPQGTNPSEDLAGWQALPTLPSASVPADGPTGALYSGSIPILEAVPLAVAARASSTNGDTWTWCDLVTDGLTYGSDDGFSSSALTLIDAMSVAQIPSAGTLVITELQLGMDGEAWVEIFNPTWVNQDLFGCDLASSAGIASWLLDSPPTLPAKTWLALDSALITGLSLDETMGRVTLTSQTEIIDETPPMTTFSFEGVSALSLRPDKISAFANDTPKSWCITDNISPGVENPPCLP